MQTIIAKLEAGSASIQTIKQAAEVIKSGGLVAFPTETVYGLGANALDEQACAKVYAAKGRPSDNPLIVHINEDFDLDRIAKNVPAGARALMDAFWPGPLTIVLKSRADVFACGHGDTVAVRMPQSMVARLLIHHSGLPIAAPSANTSGRPSPTVAAHVIEDLNGKIDMILDGGACKHGLESTVIDFSESQPKILRPGAVTREMIENVIGKVLIASADAADDAAPKSPGMKYKHYAPNAKVTLVVGDAPKVAAAILKMIEETNTTNPIILTWAQDEYLYDQVPVMNLGRRLEDVAANIFAALRKCDELGHDHIFVQGVGEEGLGAAIMNRLKKAAQGNILEV
ncbi:MAG: L-threonylcarbamoyladenylate synthase [Defluviitaleaceae bacterium]|nr:L-threonylcarbamoyladenylate synthase [Defluviitaleaceae bacterium]